MNKEFKCIDFNSKQKKHYEKWKKLIKDLSEVNDRKNEKKDKPKTFEDFFPVHTITKYHGINNLDYKKQTCLVFLSILFYPFYLY